MYRTAYLILASVPLMFCSVGIYLGILAWIAPSAGDNPITISVSTTRVTDHVDEDGFVDYEAAINAAQSLGKSPDQNAAAGLVRAFGWDTFSDSTRDQYLQDFQTTASEFAAGENWLSDTGINFGNQLESAKGRSPTDLLNQFHERPWSHNDQDAAAMNEWLARNELPVAAALEAIDLPDFYFPLHRDAGGLLFGAEVFLGRCNDLSKVLHVRAMRSLGENDIENALQDSLAIRKLARKLSGGVTPFELIASNEIELRAIVIEKAVLNNRATTAAQLTGYCDQLRLLPTRGRMPEKLDSGLRLLMLDWVNRLAKQKLYQTASQQSRPFHHHDDFFLFRKLDVDFNEAMRQVNARLDQVIDASKLASAQEQISALRQIDVRPLRRPGISIFAGLLMRSRGARGQLLADVIVSYLLPSHEKILLNENSLTAYDELIPLAFTLRARFKNGQDYPPSAADLSPNVISEIPLSPFDLSPLEYEKTESGFKLQFREPQEWQLPMPMGFPVVVAGQPES